MEQPLHPETTTHMHETFIKEESLRLLAERLVSYTYPGYPSQNERLVLFEQNQTKNAAGNLILPDGPWTIPDAPTKFRAGQLPTLQEQEAFLAAGLQLDSAGRPLHPWALDMLQNPRVGGVINRGFYYNWGPNDTSDTVAHNEQEDTILMIKRSDTGQWALPGGFIDGSETPEVAARREVAEETGIVLPEQTKMRLTYKGPVGDPRSTLHAWAETNCFVAKVTESFPCKGADDALEAAWIPVQKALAGTIFASHKLLIMHALQVS